MNMDKQICENFDKKLVIPMTAPKSSSEWHLNNVDDDDVDVDDYQDNEMSFG